MIRPAMLLAESVSYKSANDTTSPALKPDAGLDNLMNLVFIIKIKMK